MPGCGSLCRSNEHLKAIKEEAKQKEWAADKAIMEEYAAQMEKQEAARKAQVWLRSVLHCRHVRHVSLRC